MKNEYILSTPFLGSCSKQESASIIILGIGFDETASFRPGARFGPNAIREASDGLELYSPYMEIDLEKINYFDIGNIDLPFGDLKASLNRIKSHCQNLLKSNKNVLSLGGDHSISYPLVQAHFEYYPNLNVIQLDAHCDLRKEYKNIQFSHATVMHNIWQLIGPSRTKQIGIRSGTKEEYDRLSKHKTLIKNPLQELPQWLKTLKNDPIYLTIDLDVLDPSIFPGTGTPEPGGFTFNQLIDILQILKQSNIVGCDVVELSPDYDPTKVSSITAAKAVRELIAILDH